MTKYRLIGDTKTHDSTSFLYNWFMCDSLHTAHALIDDMYDLVDKMGGISEVVIATELELYLSQEYDNASVAIGYTKEDIDSVEYCKHRDGWLVKFKNDPHLLSNIAISNNVKWWLENWRFLYK